MKNAIEEKETEIKEFKKQMTALVTESGTLQKQIAAEDSQVDRLRKRRQDLLQTCRVEEISLPKKRATGEEEEEPVVEPTTTQEDDEFVKTLDFSDVKQKEVSLIVVFMVTNSRPRAVSNTKK